MKKIIVVVIAVFVMLILGIFVGVIPLGGLLDDGWDTVSHGVSSFYGNDKNELIQPHDKKAFICSYKDDGFSESISCRGAITNRWTPASTPVIHNYKYIVYLKKNAWSSYKILSAPGDTKKYITNPNPGILKPDASMTIGVGKTVIVRSYDFQILGNDFEAIKVEFWCNIDETVFDFKGREWKLMSSDEAMLYSGYGGLYLPRGIEDGIDRTYDTFEIGQEVDIRVETGKGGYSAKPWRVTLNEPYDGDIENPDDGGGVVIDKSYANDVTNGHFKFTVTKEMAMKSMQSSDPYSIRIWNELLPKGTLYVDFLDFIALAPSEVEFSIDGKKIEWGEDIAIQTRVDETFSVELSATSDIGIDYFRISVVYGVAETLLPSDPLSKLWLINTCNIGNKDGKTCSIPYTIEIVPRTESYFTIHAKAFDLEGRASKRTETCEVYASVKPVPDETIKKTTGVDDYGGGQTPGYMPWDPRGGSWEDTGQELEINWMGVLVASLIIISMILVGLFVFKEPKMIAIMGVAGTIIAILVYALFFTEIFL